MNMLKALAHNVLTCRGSEYWTRYVAPFELWSHAFVHFFLQTDTARELLCYSVCMFRFPYRVLPLSLFVHAGILIVFSE